MAIGAAGGAAVGILIANNIVRLQKGIAVASETWQGLQAKGLALSQEEVRGLKIAGGKTRPMLSGKVGGAQAEVHIVSDLVHYAHTRVSAELAQPTEAKVGVHPSPSGLMGSIRSWLGQDIEIGDPDFDPAFLISGKPESAAASVLTPTVREKISALTATGLAGFTFGDGHAVVMLTGVVTDVVILEVALDLVVEASRLIP
jgi:hypothetical protein